MHVFATGIANPKLKTDQLQCSSFPKQRLRVGVLICILQNMVSLPRSEHGGRGGLRGGLRAWAEVCSISAGVRARWTGWVEGWFEGLGGFGSSL